MDDIRIIALDLDGTLLDSDKNLSEANRAALAAVAAKGILVVPTTGRFFGMMPPAVRDLPFVRYAITVNGAQVYDRETDTAIVREELPLEQALAIMRYLDGFDVIYDCYQDDWGYVSRSMYERAGDYISDRGILELFYRSRTPVEDLKAYLRARGGSVQKAQMHFRDLRAKKKELEELPALFPEVAVSSSVPSNIEINILRANKGEALCSLCAALGIPPEETLAFGDGTNDLSMIRAAGCGVAMGNADFAVKAAADAVCDDNEHDGLAKYLEKLLEEEP